MEIPVAARGEEGWENRDDHDHEAAIMDLAWPSSPGSLEFYSYYSTLFSPGPSPSLSPPRNSPEFTALGSNPYSAHRLLFRTESVQMLLKELITTSWHQLPMPCLESGNMHSLWGELMKVVPLEKDHGVEPLDEETSKNHPPVENEHKDTMALEFNHKVYWDHKAMNSDAWRSTHALAQAKQDYTLWCERLQDGMRNNFVGGIHNLEIGVRIHVPKEQMSTVPSIPLNEEASAKLGGENNHLVEIEDTSIMTFEIYVKMVAFDDKARKTGSSAACRIHQPQWYKLLCSNNQEDGDNVRNDVLIAPLDGRMAATNVGENLISPGDGIFIEILENDHDMAPFGEAATTEKGSLSGGWNVASCGSNHAVINGQMNITPSENDHRMVPLDDNATNVGSSKLQSEDLKDSPVNDGNDQPSNKDNNCQSLPISQDVLVIMNSGDEDGIELVAHANEGTDPGQRTDHVLESGQVVDEAPTNKRARGKRLTEEDNIPFLERNMTMEPAVEALGVSKSTLKHTLRDGTDPGQKTNPVLESGQVMQEAPANKGARRKRPTEEDIISYLKRNMTMKATAEALGVSKSTLKRAWRGLNKGPWPSNKRHSSKKQKCNAGSTSTALVCFDENQKVSRDKTTKGVKEIERPSQDGRSSNLVVKAIYKEDTIIKMVFSCTPSFDKLKEEVGKKLELDMNKFKIQYLDNDNDCILMTCDADLQDACDSSETNIVRLTILDK